jgi:hypothetical protein
VAEFWGQKSEMLPHMIGAKFAFGQKKPAGQALHDVDE